MEILKAEHLRREDMFCWKTGRIKETASVYSCAMPENRIPA